MEIIHVSAECYPVAKVGGLADVVGALPKYQNTSEHFVKVIMPYYKTKFVTENKWEIDFQSHAFLGGRYFNYTILKEKSNKLGFDLYLVEIFGLLDRENVYSYDDDTERFTAFQIAVLHWMKHWEHNPDIIHCHDHHTGLIPFMMKHCYAFRKLKEIPTVFTIHNAQYQGWMSWEQSVYIPEWDLNKRGLLDWNGSINPLATAVKTAWKVTTVSNSYLDELRENANGLETLFNKERKKCVGILNGIDTEVWNPESDTYLNIHFSSKAYIKGKLNNKQALCKQFNFNSKLPLIIFIGRLVGEKAADLLPESIYRILTSQPNKVNILILGSGNKKVENELKGLHNQFHKNFHAVIGYNEKLSHLMYAGADFLLMPSRVEPCGLNQMYALRYGTMPIVRRVGGLKDTVIDIGEKNGFGICFNNASVDDIVYSLNRAINVFEQKEDFKKNQKIMMKIDNSWEKSAENYFNIYKSIIS
jgi:starch synthase